MQTNGVSVPLPERIDAQATAAAARPAVLFVAYDGALEPIGESQVLTYLLRLSASFDISLITFEKRHDLENGPLRRRIQERLDRASIHWKPGRYHLWPPVLSTAVDALCGIWYGWRICRRNHVELVHARGYVPALVALTLKWLCGTKLLFDMRGFFPDEKVVAGHWGRDSRVYRIAKRSERAFFESADGIVSLTHAGVETMRGLGYAIKAGTPIEVITTCTDLTRFRPGPRDRQLAETLGLADRVVIGCSGNLINWYMRDAMFAALALLVRRLEGARVLILTQEDHDLVRRDTARAGLPSDRLVVRTVPFAEMPDYVRLVDLAMFFIKPGYSKKGSSATKMGEFLATGVPLLINDGVGDSGAIVRDNAVGVVLTEPTAEELDARMDEVRRCLADETIHARCRRLAEQRFDADQGARDYARLYRQLLDLDRAAVTQAAAAMISRPDS